MNPTGEQYRLAAGDYAAVVTEVGATLRVLTFAGRDVVRSFAENEPMLGYRGGVLAPWPNRIGDGAYVFDGVERQLALTEVPRRTALHGLVAHLAWALESKTETEVRLRARIWPQPGYDFLLDLTITYTLTPHGLSITLAATNVGHVRAPYGSSIHPYLVTGGGGRVDAWTLTVPAATVLEVDPDRLLPIGRSAVAGTHFDFRAPRVVGSTFIDHAYTDLVADPDGTAVARIVGPDGQGAEIAWDAAQCPWLQVHTADRPIAAESRLGMALEPMTCPPDAFRSGEDVIVLDPGASHSATWVLRAVTAGS